MHLSSASYVGCFICCIIGAARLLYFALTIVQVILGIYIFYLNFTSIYTRLGEYTKLGSYENDQINL